MPSIQPRAGRPEQAFLHVAVRAEAEEADLALGLGLFAPLLHVLVHGGDAADGVDEKQVDLVGAHALQRQVEVLGHAIDRPGGRFGDEKNAFAVLRVFRKILPDTEFTVAALVGVGGVPVGDAPLHRLPQHELVVGDVEHPAHGQDGDICPGFAERPGGHPAGILGAKELAEPTRRQQAETRCPGGFQKLPA